MNAEIWFELADALKDPGSGPRWEDYLAAFFHPRTRIIPVESIFRPWSEGERTELPFARQKGYLLSDRALHMRELLRRYGLELPPELEQTPDHLIVQLEFLGFLLNNDKTEEAKIFVGEHLDWLPELLAQAEEKLAQNNYYLQVLQQIQSELNIQFG